MLRLSALATWAGLRGRFWEKDAGRITVVGSDPSRAFLGRL